MVYKDDNENFKSGVESIIKDLKLDDKILKVSVSIIGCNTKTPLSLLDMDKWGWDRFFFNMTQIFSDELKKVRNQTVIQKEE